MFIPNPSTEVLSKTMIHEELTKMRNLRFPSRLDGRKIYDVP